VLVQGRQGSLFARGVSRLDARARPDRVRLDASSWLDHWQHFVQGADALFDTLAGCLPWEQNRRQMYERVVAVPRLTCAVDLEAEDVPALIADAHRRLSLHYDVALRGAFAACYRDGRDSVAWHADRVDLSLAEHTTAIVSLGGPRKLLLRPKGGGRSRAIVLDSGDLLVMGGAFQHRWEHCVPKVAHASPRIALIFFADDREPPPMLASRPVRVQGSRSNSSSRASQASRTSR
jgi:alkylated DNA repair dioxygenase AlkB